VSCSAEAELHRLHIEYTLSGDLGHCACATCLAEQQQTQPLSEAELHCLHSRSPPPAAAGVQPPQGQGHWAARPPDTTVRPSTGPTDVPPPHPPAAQGPPPSQGLGGHSQWPISGTAIPHVRHTHLCTGALAPDRQGTRPSQSQCPTSRRPATHCPRAQPLPSFPLTSSVAPGPPHDDDRPRG
jgi:hypothetical protein